MDKRKELQALIDKKNSSAALTELLKHVQMTKGDKGDTGEAGYTPKKGKDYYTETEINSIISYIQSKVKDGARGEKGDQGIPGKVGDTPIKGIHYWTDKDQERLLADALKIIPKPKDGVSPAVDDVVQQAVNELQKRPIEFKDIKGTEKLIEFLKLGGFRGGGGSSNGGGGTPGTPLTSVQFNDGGAFGGDATFTFDKTTKVLGVQQIIATGQIATKASFALEDPGVGTFFIAIQAPTLAAGYTLTLPVDDGLPGQVFTTDGSGNTSWTSNGTGNITGSGVEHQMTFWTGVNSIGGDVNATYDPLGQWNVHSDGDLNFDTGGQANISSTSFLSLSSQDDMFLNSATDLTLIASNGAINLQNFTNNNSITLQATGEIDISGGADQGVLVSGGSNGGGFWVNSSGLVQMFSGNGQGAEINSENYATIAFGSGGNGTFTLDNNNGSTVTLDHDGTWTGTFIDGFSMQANVLGGFVSGNPSGAILISSPTGQDVVLDGGNDTTINANGDVNVNTAAGAISFASAGGVSQLQLFPNGTMDITLVNDLQLAGFSGNPGDVITSQGGGAPPIWSPGGIGNIIGTVHANEVVYGIGGAGSNVITSDSNFTYDGSELIATLGQSIIMSAAEDVSIYNSTTGASFFLDPINGNLALFTSVGGTTNDITLNASGFVRSNSSGFEVISTDQVSFTVTGASILLKTNSDEEIKLDSSGSMTLQTGNGEDINILSDNNMIIHGGVDVNISASNNTSGDFSLTNLAQGNAISLTSGGEVNITSTNASDINLNSPTVSTNIGDNGGSGNGTKFMVDDDGQNIQAVFGAFTSGLLYMDGGGNVVLGANGDGNNTKIQITDFTGNIGFNAVGGFNFYNSNVTIDALAGSGTRYVTADSAGTLGTTAIPVAPRIISSGDVAGQTGAIASIAFHTAGGADETLRVGGYLTMNSITAGTMSMQVTYTDENNNAQTLTLAGYKTNVGTSLVSVIATGNYVFPDAQIRVKSGSTTSCNTVKTGTVNYDAGYTIEIMR